MDAISFTYCCGINRPKAYGLKQQKFIISPNSVAWLDGSSVAFTWVMHMTANAGQSAEL